MKKYVVTLTKEEREVLGNLASKGKHNTQKILNALILLDSDTGEHQVSRSTNEEIARVLNISMRKIDRVKKRFVEEGFDAVLDKRKTDRAYEKKTDGDFEAHLILLRQLSRYNLLHAVISAHDNRDRFPRHRRIFGSLFWLFPPFRESRAC